MHHVLQYDRKRVSPKEQQYIDSVVDHANQNNFTVHLIQKKYVIYGGEGSKVNGYVSDASRVLATATARPKKHWFATFIHEASHMDQCIEGAKIWTDLKVSNLGADACELVFYWLDGLIELNRKQLKDYMHRTMMLELDCERRAAEKVLLHGLDIDIDEYIQQANAYVYFYPLLRKTRKWYSIGKEPYAIKEICSAMPKDFDNDYTRLPANFEKLYRKFCY